MPSRQPIRCEPVVRDLTTWCGLLVLAGLITSCSLLQETQSTTASAAHTPSPRPPAPDEVPPVWSPDSIVSWQWQLTTPINESVPASVYDVDLFDTPPEVVARLRAQGGRVICYLSAGSHEDWRPDSADYPTEILGKAYAGWPGERWLDIRRLDLLGPIVQARLEMCREKGFDAVEADNVDSYQADTGFPLTAEDQLAFNRWLAGQAHANGLAIALKNDPEQADLLADAFDFSILEDCFADGWCELMAPFAERGKAVLAAEYTDRDLDFEEFCAEMARLRFLGIRKERQLGAWREACP